MTIKRVILFVLAGCCLSLLVLRWPFHEEKPWKKTLLIINYNHPHYETIPFLKKIYEKDFPNIVFYGEKPFDGVETVDHYHGWFGQRVIEHAMRKWPNYAGYLMINDDCLVNYWNLRRLNPKKIWLVPASTFRLEQNSSEWCWWHCPFGYQAAEPAYRALPLEFSKKLQRNLGPQNVRAGMADVVYIPQKCRSRFLSMCPLFNDVFLEIAMGAKFRWISASSGRFRALGRGA